MKDGDRDIGPFGQGAEGSLADRRPVATLADGKEHLAQFPGL
jgi:hypothetical protein